MMNIPKLKKNEFQGRQNGTMFRTLFEEFHGQLAKRVDGEDGDVVVWHATNLQVQIQDRAGYPKG